MSEYNVAVGRGPICPYCYENRFDDWHLNPGLRAGSASVSIEGRLLCHGCGKFFHVKRYHDGEVHCSTAGHRKRLGPQQMINDIDLVQRLRSGYVSSLTARYAADAIERLTSERDAAQALKDQDRS